MKSYLDMVEQVLEHGYEKYPVRMTNGQAVPVEGGIKTLACPNVFFSHNMSDGFPLLTTKRIAWKSLRVELEGFIRGITSKKWYQERGCKFWDHWANPYVVNKAAQKLYVNCEDPLMRNKINILQQDCDDLGPIYGYQWRRFGEAYDENDGGVVDGYDQFQYIADTLRTNPSDRRMVCSAWNPNQLHIAALPSCHMAWNVSVMGDKLNLFWMQRSADLCVGVPINIGSYALLLELLASHANLEVGNLSAVFVDCHIYENQIASAEEQIKRTPIAQPSIMIRNNSGELNKVFDIFDWTYKDVELLNYNPCKAIDFGKIAV